MASTTKAVILSAIVFPGTGQLLQKNYIKAAIIIGLSAALLYIGFSQILAEANRIVAEMNATGSTSFGAANAETQAVIDRLDNPAFNAFKFGLPLCWLFSIIDVVRFGKKQNQLTKEALVAKAKS